LVTVASVTQVAVASRGGREISGSWPSRVVPLREGEIYSRNRLSETFLSALAVDFDQHGIGVIERVRMEHPHDYLRIVVAALPKDMNMRLSTQQRRLELLTDAELTAIIRDSEQFLEAPKDE
jgi:hypothetical protein